MECQMYSVYIAAGNILNSPVKQPNSFNHTVDDNHPFFDPRRKQCVSIDFIIYEILNLLDRIMTLKR